MLFNGRKRLRTHASTAFFIGLTFVGVAGFSPFAWGAPIAERGLAGDAANALKPRLAVVPFAGVVDASPFVDQLLAQIKPDEYELYDRAKLSTLMVERNVFPADLAHDNAAAIRFGQDVGVQYIVIGTLTQDKQTDIAAELLDCRSGQVIAHATTHFDKPDESAAALLSLAGDLKLREDHPPAADAGANLLAAVNDAFKVTLAVVPAKPVYVEGDVISFSVTSNQDCFLTLVTRDSQGTETYLIPNPWQLGQTHMKAGETVSFPPKGSSFQFAVSPPHGQTIVKVVATAKELKLSDVELARMKAQADPNAQKSFVAAPHGAKAIGIEGDDEPPVKPQGAPLHELLGAHDWATAEVSFLTRPKD